MKRTGFALLFSLLLIIFSGVPSRTQEGPPTPKEIEACRRDCAKTYRQCVKDGGDEPLCEAAFAFCSECCTGGCRPAE